MIMPSSFDTQATTLGSSKDYQVLVPNMHCFRNNRLAHFRSPKQAYKMHVVSIISGNRSNYCV